MFRHPFHFGLRHPFLKGPTTPAQTIYAEHGRLGFWRSSSASLTKSFAGHVPFLYVHGTLKEQLPVDHLKIHVIVNSKFKQHGAIRAIINLLTASAKEVGWPRTIGRLYHSTSGAAVQITFGGISMGLSMEVVNQLFERLKDTKPTAS